MPLKALAVCGRYHTWGTNEGNEKMTMIAKPGASRPPRGRVVGITLAIILALVAPTAAPRADAAGGSDWSPEEQQFIYELNRARWDPSIVGITDGSVLPRPPLAFDDALAEAAGFRVDEMAQYEYFDHQSPVTGLWPNETARDHGYPLPRFWPDEANNIESIHYGHPTVAGVLQSLIDSFHHRNHLLGQGWYGIHREVGVGAHLGDRLWAVMTATDETGDVFLTGVVYADADGNRRMDLGEGLEGVTVTARTYSTVTGPGGGWSLRVPPSNYKVSATGGGFVGTSSRAVRIGDYNVGVDFISGRRGGRVHSYETCNGLVPTILGTEGKDYILGTPGDDVIVGGPGRDRIRGLGGDDVICGGDGNDRLLGGKGTDFIIGGPGIDTCLTAESTQECEA